MLKTVFFRNFKKSRKRVKLNKFLFICALVYSTLKAFSVIVMLAVRAVRANKLEKLEYKYTTTRELNVGLDPPCKMVVTFMCKNDVKPHILRKSRGI